jgi:hypothetical protein
LCRIMTGTVRTNNHRLPYSGAWPYWSSSRALSTRTLASSSPAPFSIALP